MKAGSSARVSSHAGTAAGLAGLVEEEHVHPLDLRLGAAMRNEERRARVAHAEVEILRTEHLRARDRDEAEPQRAEQDQMPVGGLAHEHEQPVAAP